MSNNDLSANDK